MFIIFFSYWHIKNKIINEVHARFYGKVNSPELLEIPLTKWSGFTLFFKFLQFIYNYLYKIYKIIFNFYRLSLLWRDEW